jgi:hypothetical protein
MLYYLVKHSLWLSSAPALRSDGPLFGADPRRKAPDGKPTSFTPFDDRFAH